MLKIDGGDVILKLNLTKNRIMSAIPLAQEAIANDLISDIRYIARNKRDFPKDATGRFLGGLNYAIRESGRQVTTIIESDDRDSKFIDRTTRDEYVIKPGELSTDDLLNPITKWARDKNINLYNRDDNVGSPSVARYSALDSDQKFPIFAIARTIARQGVKNTGVFLEALRKKELSFGRVLEDEINKVL